MRACIIVWLGGQEAFPEWTMGAIYRFLGGNYPTYPIEFYCSLGIVAEVPPYVDRPGSARLAWAGEAPAAAGAAAAAGDVNAGASGSSPHAKRSKQA